MWAHVTPAAARTGEDITSAPPIIANIDEVLWSRKNKNSTNGRKKAIASAPQAAIERATLTTASARSAAVGLSFNIGW